MISERAYAKVNLGLDVLRRLPNGYHELNMVMQTIDLFDELTLEKAESGIKVFTGLDALPGDESNLIYKAAKAILETYSIDGGVEIKLLKRIPMAAGMAGGSADAAATLRGINRLYDMNLSEEDLCKIGVKIGADVPYCIMMGTCQSRGIGEILDRLPSISQAKVLIAKPDLDVSTKWVYENLKLDETTKHPDMDKIVSAIKAGELNSMCAELNNVLESVTVQKYPVIHQLKMIMNNNGATVSLMSGSGPTVFGIFMEEDSIDKAYEAIKESGLAKDLLITEFYNPEL